MAKQVITEGISGETAANIINENNTELYTGAETVAANAKSTPVDADVMPIQDSAAANVKKKVTWANIKATLANVFITEAPVDGTPYDRQDAGWVASGGGGGGVEYQIYGHPFFIDATLTTNWMGESITISPVEFRSSAAVLLTNSIILITAANLKTKTFYVAQGNQTVESLRIKIGVNVADITHFSIIKARLNATHDTIDSIAVLLETTVTPLTTDGYLDFEAVDFTETAISDKDLIYIFFGSSTLSDVTPCYWRLKCVID